MPRAPLPANETERLNYLHRLNLLDTLAEESFDQITQLAADLFAVPTALVSLIDEQRQWFKSRVGLDVCETSRDLAFCAHALHEQEMLIVEDATQDSRFADNPLVGGELHLRFYAGVVLRPDGVHAVGTLCLLDYQPRTFSEQDLQRLRALGKQVEALIRLHEQRILYREESKKSRRRALRLEALFQEAAAGIVQTDEVGTILAINQYAAHMLGYKRTELLGENVSRLMPAHLAVHHDMFMRRYLETGEANIIGKGRRVDALHADGTLIPINLAISHLDYGQDAEQTEFIAILTDLTELTHQLQEKERISEQLRIAYDQAQQASRAKSEFLSAMSHELRTPLNAILGFAQLLNHNQKQPLSERQQRQVEQIYQSGSHLLELINEVLDLSSIEAGRMNLSLEPIQLAGVVDDVLSILSPIATKHQVRLKLAAECGCEPAPIVADYTRLKQVLINLISNGIKYNHPEGTVELGCEVRGSMLRVHVRDTGIGIADDKLEQLFEPFNRLGAERSEVEGTGVGLALTKRIVEQMQGRLGVHSQVGHGSDFWFELPLASAQPVTQEA